MLLDTLRILFYFLCVIGICIAIIDWIILARKQSIANQSLDSI